MFLQNLLHKGGSSDTLNFYMFPQMHAPILTTISVASPQVPELNVQNGVLKALSFLFEYIGEMGKDYIYAVTPLLQDALMDRDLVHRQTAAAVVQHMSLGVQVGDFSPPPPPPVIMRPLKNCSDCCL